MSVPQINLGTILRLLLASLVVGMVMAYFAITPRDVWYGLTGFADEFAANAASWAQWGISYVLLGAVIVVPIWAIAMLLRVVKRR